MNVPLQTLFNIYPGNRQRQIRYRGETSVPATKTFHFVGLRLALLTTTISASFIAFFDFGFISLVRSKPPTRLLNCSGNAKLYCGLDCFYGYFKELILKSEINYVFC